MNENGTLQPLPLMKYNITRISKENGLVMVKSYSFRIKMVSRQSLNLADRITSANKLKEEISYGLIFMGLVGIEDPPRKILTM